MKKIISFLYFFFLFVLLYGQIFLWQNIFLGFLVTALYLVSVGRVWQANLITLYIFKKREWVSLIVSIFVTITLMGLISSIFVVFYRLSSVQIIFVYFFNYLLSLVFGLIIKKQLDGLKFAHSRLRFIPVKGANIKPVFKKSYLVILLYLFVVVLGFHFLQSSESAGVHLSPWQAIDKNYLLAMFAASFLLGCLLFSKFNVKTILLLIIIHSFLLHSYLPLSHKLPWGGDVWRHLAVEKTLLEGGEHPPVLFGPSAKWREVGGVIVPEVFLIPNKYAYGQHWGTAVLFSRTMALDLVTINKWLLPIVWALVFPILLFRIGGMLFGSWRFGLIFGATGAIPFTWTALGSLTLPVSLGLLTFLLSFWFYLLYLKSDSLAHRNMAYLIGALMLWGYTLYFLLFWFLVLAAFLLKKIQTMNVDRFGVKAPLMKKIIYTVIFFISIFFFPVIELLSKISYVPEVWNVVQSLKHIVGQWSGWYMADKIRDHDILSGNIFFNHTPDWAYVESLFTMWRFHVMAFMLMAGMSVLTAILILRKEKEKLMWHTMAFFLTCVPGGYILGWHLLEGDRLFVRRMDGLIAFVLIAFMLLGIARFRFFLQSKLSPFVGRLLLILSIFFVSWFGTTAHASGPDMRVVSVDEYGVAEFILTSNNIGKPCVLGDTWALLALEALSASKIVGGGFPIDYQFAQPERIVLYSEIIKDPRASVLKMSHDLTGGDQCYVAVPDFALNEDNTRKLTELLGEELEIIGKWHVWRE